jgi:hypothetical protein
MPATAEAQFISLNLRLTISSIIDITVTQGGSSEYCGEPENSPRENVFVLRPRSVREIKVHVR